MIITVPRHDVCACGRKVVRPTQVAVPSRCPCGTTYVLERATSGPGSGQGAARTTRGIVLTDKATGGHG